MLLKWRRGRQPVMGWDLTVSITGVAGPGGGSERKPVGTVAFAVSDGTNTHAQMLALPNRGRTNIRTMAASIALGYGTPQS